MTDDTTTKNENLSSTNQDTSSNHSHTSKNNSSDPEDLTNIEPRDIKWRERWKHTTSELEQKKIELKNTKKELEGKIQTMANEKAELANKAIMAELKAEAVSEGIKDLDFLKMMDTSQLRMNEKGEITGLKDALTNFKQAKPDCFGGQKKDSTTSNADYAKTNTETKPFDASTLSKKEWAERESDFMAGKFS